MYRVLTLLLLCFVLPVSAGAQDVATVTLVEGSLKIIRGTTLLQGGEGIRLRAGDILSTSNPGFTQLEFVRGPIVALGPSTRVYLMGRGTEGNLAELVMLGGWLKAENHENSTAYRYDTPELAGTASDGTLLVHAGTGSAEIFVESGAAKVAEVAPGGGASTRGAAAKAGQFFSRAAGKPVTTAARPDSSFLESMPHPFRDTLPSRLARFSGKAVEPKREHEVSYPDVEAWLNMHRAWRRGFVERFQSRLNDAAFRRGLETHLGEHPEWDRILHPEKYEPKPPASAAQKDTSHGR
ncbi:MAG: hypothetical protein ACXVZR_02900 [Terriglobales bacterium]